MVVLSDAPSTVEITEAIPNAMNEKPPVFTNPRHCSMDPEVRSKLKDLLFLHIIREVPPRESMSEGAVVAPL